MKISYIIPCYNESKNIEACIYSIKADTSKCLDLTDYEIIVVNNNSTDDSEEKAINAGANVIVHEKQKGVVYARNKGAESAKFDILANIDADNNIPIGWSQVVIDNMKDETVAAISGPLKYDNVSFLLHLGTKLFYVFARIFHHIAGPTIQGGNYVIRKSIWQRMGGYDTSFLFYGEDTRTAQLASQHGKIKLVPALWINSSSRRLKKQGLIHTVWTYTVNYFSVCFFHKNVTKDYNDYR